MMQFNRSLFNVNNIIFNASKNHMNRLAPSFIRALAAAAVLLAAPAPPPVHGDAGSTIRAVIEEARTRRRARKNRKRVKQGITAFWALGGRETIHPLPCMLRAGVNLLYLGSRYYPEFTRAKGDFSTVVMGDSTGAISALVPGWMNKETTYSIAVPGNRLCHMRMTFHRSLPVIKPRVIIVTTLGGNDLLAGASDEDIIAQTVLLLLDLRKRFPDARLVGVGIHPTLVDFANKRKDLLNLKLAAAWKKDEGSCWVDPLPAFGVPPGSSALPGHMFPNDSIHYNERTALAIGKLIRESCGIDF